jgi:hypothetical protein
MTKEQVPRPVNLRFSATPLSLSIPQRTTPQLCRHVGQQRRKVYRVLVSDATATYGCHTSRAPSNDKEEEEQRSLGIQVLPRILMTRQARKIARSASCLAARRVEHRI